MFNQENPFQGSSLGAGASRTLWEHSPGESVPRRRMLTAQPSTHPAILTEPHAGPQASSWDLSQPVPCRDHLQPSLPGFASPLCTVCLPPSLSPYLTLPHQHARFPLLIPSFSLASGAPGLTFSSPGYLQEGTSEEAVTGDFPAPPAPAPHGAAGGRFLTADIINSANPQIPPSCHPHPEECGATTG